MKGRVLAGKYRLVAELGRGGMGSVWRADHIELRSPVAVKLIDPVLAETREGQSRFLREARAAGSLRSTHVVSVFDYGVDEGTPFLVMELLEGESLATRLEKRGKLPVSELTGIMRQVVRGLSKAHAAGIVHRDLKPENIFITIEGDSEVVKVLDFGIAKVDANIAVSVQTQTGMVLGTPYYMSPEQAEGRRELDSRSDIWSLGVIVYECLLGTRPFDGDNLAQIILAICADALPVPSKFGEAPEGFDAWFARAVARRLEERFQTVQDFVDELALLGSAAPSASATTEPAPPLVHVSPVPQPEGSPSVPNEPLASSSLEWSKDPAPARADSGLYQVGSVRAVSTSARLAVGASMIAVLGIVGVGGWLWSNSGASAGQVGGDSAPTTTSSPEVNGATTASPQSAPSPVAPPSNESPVVNFVHHTSSTGAGQAAGSASPAASGAPAPEVGKAATSNDQAAPGTVPPSAVQPASAGHVGAPVTTVRSAPLGHVPTRGKTGGESAKPAVDASGLYCSYNALSGRLVRVSASKVGSFPCYVHSLSGELRKKD